MEKNDTNLVDYALSKIIDCVKELNKNGFSIKEIFISVKMYEDILNVYGEDSLNQFHTGYGFINIKKKNNHGNSI